MVIIIAALSVSFLMGLLTQIFHVRFRIRTPEEKYPEHSEPFLISAYYSHIEQVVLDDLENREPVDRTIILWWGLDGLRLSEDGDLEWISRKKPKLVNQNISYQPCQSMTPMPQYDICQSTQAQIDWLRAQNTILQIQATQQQQMQNINSALQSYVIPMAGMVQTPATYSPYHYAGCFCNFLG